jgi:two-component system response regulator YesN
MAMYRLLVVDDEAIIADGLYEVFLNLNNLELDVYKAYSGNEALKLLERTRIDIVLTDIRMPGIDGLQLLEMIHESWPKCKVIFLTGYNEFDYVYTAIKFPGVSYLLKTEGYGKIIDAVEKAVHEIESSMKNDELIQKAKEQLGTMTELLRRDYLNNILKGEFSKKEIGQKQFNELGISLNSEESVIILIGKVDGSGGNGLYSENTTKQHSIKLIVEQYISTHAEFTYLIFDNSILVWFIQPLKDKFISSESSEEIWKKLLTFTKGNLELVQVACKEALDISISFVIDDSPVKWTEVADHFDMLKMLQNYRISSGSGMLITNKNIADSDLPKLITKNQESLHIRQRKLEVLSLYLDSGNGHEFTNTIDELTSNLLSVDTIHDTYAQEIYYSIAIILLSYINKWNLTEKIPFKIGLYKLMAINEHASFKNAVEYLKKLSCVLFDMQSSEEEKRAQSTISKVLNYINDNISEDLSLVKLADLVYFNPSYLSRLFKSVVGENLSDYIYEVKIRKSKELLENTQLKIHEIAASMGYYSTTNFIRFFKKLTNITPQDYRDSIMNK